ncbi:MAG: hypothetical protein EOM19_00650 [Candidatus Moranbacteria bacterium]|nr:hypothetical protein [Candidatus Moranbacteria bacterium]
MLSLYKDILAQEAQALIHFSDVFSAPEVDFDAELTTIIRNFGVLSDKTYFVGGNAKLAGYGSVLLNDLICERKRISEKIDLFDPYSKTTLFSILNSLPREGYEGKDFPNGRDFLVAITQSGVCFFATPPTTLSALETRNEIVALYRVENKNIPFTDGLKEQFRSSIIALSRFLPDSMETLYEYENREALLETKRQGNHITPIPTQEQEIELAFADRFGNVRLSVRDGESLRSRLEEGKGKEVTLRINEKETLSAFYGEALSHIPIGSLGLYENVADSLGSYNRRATYWEFIKRSDHCLDDYMALDILKEKSGGDIWNAKIEIKV